MTDYYTEVLSDSPLFLTQLDRFVNGSAVPDSSGNARDGTAWQFGFVPYGTGWLDQSSAFSICAWIKTSATGLNMIACREGATGRTFQLRTSTDSLQFIRIVGGTLTVGAATSINDGSWHLVGATWDGSNIRVYKDSSTPIATSASTTALTGTQGLSIGWRPNTSLLASTDLFQGEIRGLAVFSSALAGSRFAAYYAAGVPTGIPSASGWDGSGTWGIV